MFMKKENIERICKNKKFNVYFKDNENLFEELFDIVVGNPKHFGRMIFSKGAQKAHKNREQLASWIIEKLPLLSDPKYTITTKCYWILNNLTNFPECVICGDPIKQNALNIDSYNKTCGKKDCRLKLASKTSEEKNISKGITAKTKEKHLRIENLQRTIKQKLLDAKTHEQFIEVFMLIYTKVGKPFIRIQQEEKYRKLYDEIIHYTPLLNNSHFTFTTRCYWFVNGITAFPICNNEKCHNEIRQNVRSFIDGYQRKVTLNGQRINEKDELYCCAQCAQSSKFTIAKKSKTKMEHFNDPFFNNRDLAKHTTFDRFGANNIMKTEVGKKHLVESIQRHFGSQYISSSQVPEVKDKIKKTNNSKSKEEKQKTSNLLKKHWSSLTRKQKQEIRQKARKTYFESTGYEHPSQNPNVKHGNARYAYDGLVFASSWELIFYIWLKIHNYQFVFQPVDSSIVYYDKKGKKHTYHPDFKILQDGKKFNAGIYEIKGDNHFDKKTGKMINISDRSKDYIAEAKHQCMLDNGVKIITSIAITEISEEVFTEIGEKKEFQKFKLSKTKLDL